MKSRIKNFFPLNEPARYVALTGLRMAALLMFCQALLLWFGGPVSYDTYEIHKHAAVIDEVLNSVFLSAIIGTVWMQLLHGREK